MDKRKVVYVCDVNNTTEFMTSRPVRALLDPLWEKYNVDFVTVQDQENLGMSFTQFAEKFEKCSGARSLANRARSVSNITPA